MPDLAGASNHLRVYASRLEADRLDAPSSTMQTVNDASAQIQELLTVKGDIGSAASEAWGNVARAQTEVDIAWRSGASGADALLGVHWLAQSLGHVADVIDRVRA
jgi:hypothetical protein